MRSSGFMLLTGGALAGGCLIENQPGGTAVGNPTGMTLTVATPQAFTFSSASVMLGTVQLTDCDGKVTALPVGHSVDLLSGADLTVPGGAWCDIDFPFDAAVQLVGTSSTGFTGQLALGVAHVRVANPGGLVVDSQPLILELAEPDWFSATSIGADVADVVIDTGPVHDALVASIQSRSAVFGDFDSNGIVDDTERLDGAYATAVEDEGDDDTGEEE